MSQAVAPSLEGPIPRQGWPSTALLGHLPPWEGVCSAGSRTAPEVLWASWQLVLSLLVLERLETQAAFMRPSGSCLWPCDQVWVTKFEEVRAFPAQTDPAFLPGWTLSWMQSQLASQGA